jgi:hypothetical protein
MAMASIDIEAMESLVSTMNTAASDLRGKKGDLVGILSGVSLDTSRPWPLETAAGWVDDQVPGLRRRLALAQAIAKSDPKFKSGPVQIDESQLSTLTPDQARQQGEHAAQMLRDGEDAGPELADMMSKYGSDPYFAAALAKNVSPQEIAEWVRDQSYSLHSKQASGMTGEYEEFEAALPDYQRIISGLSAALGTATRNESPDLALPSDYADKFADTITDENNINGEGAILGMILRNGTFGSDFLDTVAPKVYDYEQDGLEGRWADRTPTDGWFVYDADGKYLGSHDPLAGVLGALGNNAEAAQHFFNYGPQEQVDINGKKIWVSSRMKYLIQDRTWASSRYSDEGDGLGRALEAATTAYRNSDTTGLVSAELATQSIALIGAATHDGWKMYKGMRDNVANILGSYGPDLMRISSSTKDEKYSELDHLFNTSNPGFPPLYDGGLYGMNLDKEMLRRVLETIGEDDSNVEKVMAGALTAQQIRLTYAMKNGLDPNFEGGNPNNALLLLRGDNVPIIDNANDNAADMFGFIVNSCYEGDVKDEEAAKKRAEMLSKVLGIATSIPPLAITGPWTSLAVNTTKDYILGKIAEGPGGNSSEIYGEMDANTKEALRHNTMNLLLANGYLDQGVFDRANQQAGGNTYTAPPRSALMHDDHGNLVEPPQFDFSSDAYDNWATTVGVEGEMTNQIVDRYNSSWPNVR